MMCNKSIRYIYGLFLVVLLIGINFHAVKACEPDLQPWFVANFRWDEDSLPEDIELREYEDYVFVNNTTSQMAWIIEGSQHDALIKAQEDNYTGNTSTELDELVQSLVSQEKRGINIPSNPRGSILIGPNMSGLSENHPKSMGFAQTKRMMSKPPPQNVEIPNGRVFNVVLVHQQEIYPVRITMFYSINTEFDENPCGVEIFDPRPLIRLGLVLLGIGLVSFLVVKYYIYGEE